MALIYPVQADAPEPDEDAEPVFAELAADLSDQWLVEVAVGEEGDDACFGPVAAHLAWNLAVELDEKRPEWTVSIVPLYVAEPADVIIEATGLRKSYRGPDHHDRVVVDGEAEERLGDGEVPRRADREELGDALDDTEDERLQQVHCPTGERIRLNDT